MDYQLLFNLAVGVSAGFAGWMLNRISMMLDRVDSDIRNIPLTYVSKDDYRADIQTIHSKLDKVLDKLDGKMDK